MNDTLIKVPSLKRYKKIFLVEKQKLSILRILQYEMLKEVSWGKKVLDVGGGGKVAYRHMISCKSYESINIDSQMQPTWTIQVKEPFPSPKNHYDTVISLNVFEHIYDIHFILKEIYKSLKLRGNFYI